MLNTGGVRAYMAQHTLEAGIEHDVVSYIAGSARVLKDLNTFATITQGVFNYLSDLELGNFVWSDDVHIEGFYIHDDDLHIVTSQPFVKGQHPSKERLKRELVKQFGLVDLAPSNLDNMYYELPASEIGSLYLYDLKPSNVIEGPDGRLNIIDGHFHFASRAERERALDFIRAQQW